MSETPTPEEELQPEATLEKEYHFEELTEIEPAITSLVEQLKEAIENGKYSAFLSDDAGGRIPTLILKYVTDKIHEKLEEKFKNEREKAPRKVKTYFLGGGMQTPEKYPGDSFATENEKNEYAELMKYIKKLNLEKEKTLIITQFVDTGNTLRKIGQTLKDSGIDNFDFASMYNIFNNIGINRIKRYFHSEFFIGSSNMPDKAKWLMHSHEGVSGIRSRVYSPYPEKVGQQSDINESREDLKLMAERIIEKVWPEEKK